MLFFFFNDTATTEIYTLSLHDALPISASLRALPALKAGTLWAGIFIFSPVWGFLPSLALRSRTENFPKPVMRSEEHTSELQSRQYLVCRLLLEKKKTLHSLTANRLNTH